MSKFDSLANRLSGSLPVLALLSYLATGCGQDDVVPQAGCGDGVLDDGEFCDDGNALAADGCNTECIAEPGWVCPQPGVACESVCGDGREVGTETCDDSNLVDGDGCSSTCQAEAVEICSDGIDNDDDGATDCDDEACASIAECLVEICGNSRDDDNDGDSDCEDDDCEGDPSCGAETSADLCEDGVDNDADGLTDCQDTDCAEWCGTGECGDGVLDVGEACDEGDANSDSRADACRTDCTLARCGDRVIDSAEDCEPRDEGDILCRSNCTGTVIAACGSDPSTFTFQPDNGALVATVVLNRDSGDQFRPDAACTGSNGPDALGLLVLPAEGPWVVSARSESTTVPVAVQVSETCAASSTSCDAGIGFAGRGAVVVSGTADQEWVVRLDAVLAGLSETVSLRADRAGQVVALGESCTTSSFDRVCSTGQVCDADSSRCVEPNPAVVGIGEDCDDEGRIALCASGLLCDESGQCVSVPGSSCEAPLAGIEAPSRAGESVTVDVTLGELRERYDLACAGSSFGRIVEVEAPAAGLLRVQATAGEDSVVRAIGVRELCTTSASETRCVSQRPGITESVSSLNVSVERGTVSLFVFGEGTATLDVSFARQLDPGATCSDVSSGFCASPTDCAPTGRCLANPGGTCSLPFNPSGLAAGNLVEGRVAFEIPAISAVDVSQSSSCGVAGGTDLVLSFVAPRTGRLELRLVGARSGTWLRLTGDCLEPTAQLACATAIAGGEAPSVSAELSTGQTVWVVLESAGSPPSGTVVASFETLGGIGESCEDLGCLSYLQCDGETTLCSTPRVGSGEACGPGSPCRVGLWCSPATGVCESEPTIGTRCLSDAPVDVICPENLVCLGPPDAARCVLDSPPVGGACAPGLTTCPVSTVCVGGLSVVEPGICAAVPTAAGQSCDFDDAACPRGLRCQWRFDESVGTCRAETSFERNGRCPDTAAACADGASCVIPGGSATGICLAAESLLGDPCLPGTNSCELNTECSSDSESVFGLCLSAFPGLGLPCTPATVSDCIAPLVCRSTDGGDPACNVPLFIEDECVPSPEDPCLSASVCSATTEPATCIFPATRPAIGESCVSNFFCQDGSFCLPFDGERLAPRPGATCRALLAQGATCTPDPNDSSLCEDGLECVESAGRFTCQPFE